jgi:hypothetical protein
MRTKSGCSRVVFNVLLLTGLLLLASIAGFARDKNETIDATAWGTGTQLGRNVGITLIIYEYSTAADREILMEAFQKGSNKGLVNALEKMKAVGHISITGTLGYDVSYIGLIQTPTGRKIRFATNRQIKFAEAYYDTQSQSFDLTAGEIDINTQDKSKSAGVLYPAAQLGIGDDGQLTLNLLQNAWRLGNIIDWTGTPGEN